MAFYENQRTKYDIPLSHMDHKYIPTCKDVKELEKILKVLRSGIEGTYPDLEKLAEDQLQTLDPENKLLRKSEKPLSLSDLGKEEMQEIHDILESWTQESKAKEDNSAKFTGGIAEDLPPIRNADAKIPIDKTSAAKDADSQESKAKRVKPRDYREWDRFDVDAELNKVEEKPEDKREPKKIHLAEAVDGSGLTKELKLTKANYERNKGNEAFKAGDHDEAVLYYSRSLSLLPTAAAYNNRALVYLRQKKWNKAVDDCNAVLTMEPDNHKAILRRASAYQGLTRYPLAKKDVEVVLSKEPNNKQALTLLKDVEKALADQKVSGRRLVIDEVEESESKTEKLEDAVVNENVEELGNVEEKMKLEETKVAEEANSRREQNACNGSKESEHSENAEAVEFPAEKGFSIGPGGEPHVKLFNGKDSETENSVTGAKRGVTDGETAALLPPPPLEKDVLTLKDAGNELFRTGQYGEALAKYDSAIQKIPDREREKHAVNISVLYSNRAACKMKIGNCRGCVEDCDAAIKYFPNSSKPYLRRAMAYEQLEKYQEAYVDYKQALNAGCSSEVVQQGSDRCATMLQQINGSRWRDKLPKISSFSSLASLIPSSASEPDLAAAAEPEIDDQNFEGLPTENSEATFEKFKTEGNSLFSKGEYQKAIEAFTKCIDLFSDRVVPYTNRALCYLKLGQPENVLNDCNQALSLEFHNVKALYRRAQAYKMQEKYEESMIDLETVLKLDPGNSAAKKELQQVTRCKEEMQEKKAQAACLREQQKIRHRIKIQDVEEPDENEEEKTRPPPSSSSAKHTHHSPATTEGTNSSNKQQSETKFSTVKLHKVTPYTFQQAWMSLKLVDNINSYVAILDQIKPQELPKVVSGNLDEEFLMKLVQCTRCYVDSGRALQAFEYLQQLTKAQRFDMITMFLTPSDKTQIGEIFDLLAERSKDGIDSGLLAKIRNKYGV